MDKNFLKDLSKTKRLEYQLLEDVRVRQLKPHDLYLSEREIIENFRIGRTTVRQALSNLVEAGKFYKINGKGTFVAPDTKIRQILLVSHYGHNSLYNGNYSELSFINGVSTALNQAAVPFVNITMHVHEFLKLYQDIEFTYKNLAGIIFFSDYKAVMQTRDLLERKGIPFMYYGSSSNLKHLAGVNSFVYNQDHAVRMALDYLYSKGKRRIAVMANLGSIVREQRLDSYRAWVRERDLPTNLELHLEYIPLIERDKRYEQFRDFLVQNPVPADIDAVFCLDDHIARYFVSTATRLGYRIPDQFSVISVSNYPFCVDVIVPLSSVDIPFYQDGVRCANLMRELVAGTIDTINEHSVLTLVLRESA